VRSKAGRFTVFGGRKPVQLTIRIIAATNQDLEADAAGQKFRRDLYFRLNVAHLHLVPLRERKSDIPLLSRFHIGEFNRRFGRNVRGLTERTLKAFLHHDWPGNVRELRNVIEALFANLDHQTNLIDLSEPVFRKLTEPVSARPTEQELLLSALRATDWKQE
jgi:transcriptional regulator with PAS, ATPase and Fis domain